MALCDLLLDDEIRGSSHAASHHGDEPCTHRKESKEKQAASAYDKRPGTMETH